MASLQYEEIFSRVFGKVTDYDFVKISADDLYSSLSEKIHITLSKPYTRRLFSKVSMDDVIMNLDFEMAYPTNAEQDSDFVCELIALGVVIEWLEPQVKSTLLTHQMITSNKESKYYSQAQQLAEMKGLLNDCKKEQRKLIQDRGWIYNSYLGNK